LSEKFTGHFKHARALAINRTNSENFVKMDSVVVPADMSGDIEFYLRSHNVSYLKDIDKIILLYPTTQTLPRTDTKLIYTRPTNMGRKQNQTPTGLFMPTGKQKKLPVHLMMNGIYAGIFNVETSVGWHQYSLPGYPTSRAVCACRKKTHVIFTNG
jgi:hypothetical protein